MHLVLRHPKSAIVTISMVCRETTTDEQGNTRSNQSVQLNSKDEGKKVSINWFPSVVN